MKKVSGSPLPLGVTYKNGRANFAMEVPEGKTCKLLLYRKGEASLLASYVFSDRIGSVCYMAVDGLKEEAYEYNYDIDGECVTDSYAKAFKRSTENFSAFSLTPVRWAFTVCLSPSSRVCA